jgi:hypothetical protein
MNAELLIGPRDTGHRALTPALSHVGAGARRAGNQP